MTTVEANLTVPSESSALRLARYLREFVGLRSAVTREVEKYESVLWWGSLPHEEDCDSPAWHDAPPESGAWLTVRKQKFPDMPVPPASVGPWISLAVLKQATPDAPPLSTTAFLAIEKADGSLTVETDSPVVEHRLEDHPDVQRDYDKYCEYWRPWSAETRRRESIQMVFAKLFRLHTEISKQGELFELVMGLGLLIWRPKSSSTGSLMSPIRRHFVTAKVELEYELATGTIRVIPSDEGAGLKIEDEMLEAEQRPEQGQYATVNAQLNDIGEEVWDRARMHTALESWSSAFHSDSVWSPGLGVPDGSPDHPQVGFTPALILRKRNQAGLKRIYQSLIDQLQMDGANVPIGWQSLVEDIEDDSDWNDTTGTAPDQSQQRQDNEVYFPLPSNREQRRIVKAINRKRGVLVQGPPGTGKSHTIANLICHLLADGKRVLVTAETGRALRVLKDKLPKELQPLCISLLGQGGESFSELNAAVEGITQKLAGYTPGEYDGRIGELEKELDEARRRLASIDTRIRELRQDETTHFSAVGGAYVGTASEIAKRVSNEREHFSWLQLDDASEVEPRLKNAELLQFLEISRKYNSDQIAETKLNWVPSGELCAPRQFAELITDERTARETVEQFSHIRAKSQYAALAKLAKSQRDHFLSELRSLQVAWNEMPPLDGEYSKRALADILLGRGALWRDFCEQAEGILTKLEELIRKLGDRTVSVPKDHNRRTLRADAAFVADYLSNGGKWKTLGLFTQKPLKGKTYFCTDVLVDGAPSDTPERLLVVCDHVDAISALDELQELWPEDDRLPAVKNSKLRLAAMWGKLTELNTICRFANRCRELGLELNGVPGSVAIPEWTTDGMAEYVLMLETAELDERLRYATTRVTVTVQALQRLVSLHDVHPVVVRFSKAVEARNVEAYSEAYAEVLWLQKAKTELEVKDSTGRTFLETCPETAREFSENFEEQKWDERFAQFEAAWKWNCADTWLRRRTDPEYAKLQWRNRGETEKAIGSILAQLAGLKAWGHFFSRLKPPQAAALRGWRNAVKAMGKGTGKSARFEALRREAREYLNDCRDAVPIWIMPKHLVAEMIDPEPGRYDLVIVDEASQLGIDSLFLFYVAKKLIVVGDDQQISPYGVGIPAASVSALQQHYLRDVRHLNALLENSSLYANARIRFGQNVVLREHFRCMPEIIQFSNDLCYANNGTPLDPLRPYAGNRLEPLVLRHVEDGYRKGVSQNVQNPPEAEAIVDQIVRCLADPRYRGLTFGVISLQGPTQAQLIERLILNQIEPEEIEQRRLICGDAYAFQGDERDVIFLSLVAATGDTRIGALADESARQRFNVAASRARDQMWLFHSATLDVLSPKCMRYAFLKYMTEPKRKISEESEQIFDSNFERDVFRDITARGYHVRTQVCVGDPTNHRYRIDLVVEGMKGRLAVECDGDQWHGPERYDQDVARQRDIERAGWSFVRIRGGDYYRDRSDSLEELWAELKKHGIEPGGIDEPEIPPASGTGYEHEQRGYKKYDNTPNDESSPLKDETSESDDEIPFDSEETDNATGKYREADRDDATGIEITVPRDWESSTKRTAQLGLGLSNDSGADSEVGAVGYPDPRIANHMQLCRHLKQIVGEHGPIICEHAYQKYLEGAGVSRLGRQIRHRFNRAMAALLRNGDVMKVADCEATAQLDMVVRSPQQPEYIIREGLLRPLERIPENELRALMYRIKYSDQSIDELGLMRSTLERYGLKRLTAKAEIKLAKIIKKILTIKTEEYI